MFFMGVWLSGALPVRYPNISTFFIIAFNKEYMLVIKKKSKQGF